MKKSSPRYLTKSRFKQALDCPTKLYYTKKSEYVNNQQTDTFLESLAQGGFQVEELARMNYPSFPKARSWRLALSNMGRHNSHKGGFIRWTQH